MLDEEPAAVDRRVDNVAADLDAAEFAAAVTADHGVMVAGQIVDLGPLPGLLQDEVDNPGIDLRPVPFSFEFPQVENIADQIEILRFGGLQEVVELGTLDIPAAQMGIGDPDTSEVHLLHSMSSLLRFALQRMLLRAYYGCVNNLLCCGYVLEYPWINLRGRSKGRQRDCRSVSEPERHLHSRKMKA